jgi:SAM-dependent methyltransferase
MYGLAVTQAMMDKVDKSGSAVINLHNHDTGSFPAHPSSYDVVTGYSFLHHLYDINPTLKTAYTALKPGGKLFCDLDPNYYYWESIHKLDRSGNYDPIVKREIEMVTYKDEDIEKNFGVSKDIFNNAEFGKNIAGGFKEEELVTQLKAIGFSHVSVFYYWFLGQASLINDSWGTKEERLKYADVMDSVLQRSLPVSRNLYKYMGFIATK